jgi:hypothetical protein
VIGTGLRWNEGRKGKMWWDVCGTLVSLERTKLTNVNRDHLDRLESGMNDVECCVVVRNSVESGIGKPHIALHCLPLFFIYEESFIHKLLKRCKLITRKTKKKETFI